MNTVVKALLLGGAGYVAYQVWRGSTSSATTGTTTSAPPSSSSTPTPSAGFNSLSSLYGRVVQDALADYNAGDRSNQLSIVNGVPQTIFDAWNYFLNKEYTFTGPGLPSYSGVTGGAPDPLTPLTPAQYWSLMSPWLNKNYGLSGMGAFREYQQDTPRNPFYVTPRRYPQ